ncbi:MAG: hypothetical protein CBR30_06675 [Dictyoglomus sp. NZ13-RE01]|nr:MAG: hypothetical protein CBR30_06675 [Dictyoglomus sp. NZ13-RE01]
MGVLTGISQRFDLIVLSSPAKSRVFSRIPQEISIRQTIQYASNLKDGVEKIISTPTIIGRNLVFVSKDDAVVVEISSQKSALRTFEDGDIIVTNHYEIEEMQKEQGDYYGSKYVPDDFYHLAMTKDGSKERYAKMRALLNNPVDFEKAKQILSSVSNIGTVQSVIAIPKKGDFWIANNGNQTPVTNREWINFSIKDLLSNCTFNS